MDQIELIQCFHEDCRLRGLSSSTCRTYTHKVRAFAAYMDVQDIKLDEAGKDAIKLYLNHLRMEKHLRGNSIETIFAAVSSFYSFLEEEGLISFNPVDPVKKRYLHNYKKSDETHIRRIITVIEASRLVNSVLDVRDKTIVTLLLKTGIRRNELISLDKDDVNINDKTIILKHTAKRTNRLIYFDDESAILLGKWLRAREVRNKKNSPALFISSELHRIQASTIQRMIKKYARRVGIDDPNSNQMQDHFSPHCCRHWFTTHLRRAGMPREFIQELRGDVRREAIDIYDHIDKKELKESYLAHIPQLGI
jgi:integrase/recombinase XerD